MSKTFRQWVLFTAVCVAVGIMINVMYTSLGVSREEVNHVVRKPVDFTVLPKVLPDGTEEVAEQAPAPTTEAEVEAETEVADSAPAEQTETPATEQAQPAETTTPEPVKPPLVVVEETPTPPAPEPLPQVDATPDVPGQAKSVTLAETPSGFVITATMNKGVADTSYMNLSDPKRLVIDLRGVWTYTGTNVIRSEGAIKHIVVGEHSDRLRLVVHFRTPPSGRLEPRFAHHGTTVTISVPLQ